MVYLDRLNVNGSFEKVVNINGYVILFELYNKQLDIWYGKCIWQVTYADSNVELD